MLNPRYACVTLFAAMIFSSIKYSWAVELPPGWTAREEGVELDIPAYCAGGFLAEEVPLLERTDSLRLRAQHMKREGDIIYLRKDIEIVHPLLLFQGEEAFYDVNDDSLEFVGAASIYSPSLIATADGIFYDEEKLEMGLTNFSLPRLHAWGRADSFIRQEHKIDLGNARFSFCDPQEESWHLKAKNVRLNEHSLQGSAQNARLYAGSVPVLYLPYLAFPLGTQRRSGLLYPQLALDELNGLTYSQPIYFNIVPQLDTTTYLHLIQRRGLLMEQELRWLSRAGTTTVVGSYIPNDDIYGEARDAEHIEFSSALRDGWSGELLYTRLSDGDYLVDLPHSFTSQDDVALPRDAHIRYLTPRAEWTFGWRDYQLLRNETAIRIAPYSQLPYTSFGYLSPTWYGFHLFDNAEYTVFAREESRDEDLLYYVDSGKRLHNSLGISWDRYIPWGFLKVTSSADTNHYRLSNETARSELRRLSIDMGLEYSIGAGWCDSCQWLFVPRLYGLSIDKDARGRLPVFDTIARPFSYDMLFSPYSSTGNDLLRIEDEQRMSAGLENRFINEQGEENYLVRIGRAAFLESENDARWDYSPWMLDASVRFSDLGYLDWNLVHNERRSFSHGLSFKYRTKKHDGFSLSYYEDALGNKTERREQLGSNFVWRLQPRWSLFGAMQYDLNDEGTLLSINGFMYENCCASAQFGFYERNTAAGSETGFVFQFLFKPLGGGDLGHNVIIGKIQNIYEDYEHLY